MDTWGAVSVGMFCSQGDGQMAECDLPAITAGQNYLKQEKVFFFPAMTYSLQAKKDIFECL